MSALVASPAELDKVQGLQRTLYRAAKADPGRRFHALFDKVHRRDVLERGWVQVRRNSGAPGIDRKTIDDIEEYGVARLLDELATDLREHRYRPLPARRVWIPKPGSSEQRPLSITAVRDRIVQAAVKTAIEPIFEADFSPVSFGFRPKRSAHDALQVLVDEAWRSRLWVPIEEIVEDLNQVLRGWAGYFRYGNSARHFEKAQNHALERLALQVAKRHHRSRQFGWSVVAFQSSNRLGLIDLSGIVVAPRPFRDWRGRPNAGGERRR